jgi:hypothetical protein
MTACTDTSIETEATTLVTQVKAALEQLGERKATLHGNMTADRALAVARFSSGSHMGSVLSMRKAHKNKVKLAYLAGSRFELNGIRKELEEYLDPRNQAQALDVAINLTDLRTKMKTTLGKLDSYRAPTPTDEVLLNQLELLMDLRERASF